MGQRPPERYEPGELDNTRKNIGEVSREEAARIAGLLGGEVGVEKTAEDLSARYRELRRKNASAGRSIAGFRNSSAAGRNQPFSRGAYTAHFRRASVKNNSEPSFSERIRINRLAAREEHGLKTRTSLIADYLGFAFKPRDYINPAFLIHADNYFYSHIETLVLSVREMTHSIDRRIYAEWVSPFHKQIIRTITDWDLATLSSELSSLQRNPRKREFRECAQLCRCLYRPVIILSPVGIDHINSALERLYSLLQLLDPAGSEKHIAVFAKAGENTTLVFRDVAFTCYPMLLKLTSNRFFFYRDLLRKNRSRITDFLRLENSDLLRVPDSPERISGRPLKELADLINGADGDQDPGPSARTADEISDGLKILNGLFPDAGWADPDGMPDLYAYYQPLFEFPRETVLIPPEDPLQKILVLTTIVQELLYGFRFVEFREKESAEITAVTDKWHILVDELFKNNYGRLLLDYCHNIEKGMEFSTSSYVQKQLSELMWFRRKIFLPHMKIKHLYRSAVPPASLPRLFTETRKLYLLLDCLIKEFDESPDRHSLMPNYDKAFKFEIKNTTSIQLKRLLDREKIASTNENLVRYSLSVISVLDFLINSPLSPFYDNGDEPPQLFRQDPVYSSKPLYNVGLKNTHQLLNPKNKQD